MLGLFTPDLFATLADTLGGWTNDLNPIIVTILGVSIRWYGVSYLAGFAVAWFALRKLARRKAVLVPVNRIEDFMVIMAVGVIVGGRLGYCLFYEPSLFVTFEPNFPFWGVLMINKGGMASHGGIIGVIIASWYISRGFKTEDGTREGKCSPLHIMDIAALLVPFGMFFGRLANFINGELLGKIVAMPGQRAPWWAVRFPQELLTGHAPPLTNEQSARLSQIIEANRLPGESDYGVVTNIISRIQHGSVELKEQLEPLLAARHPSQLYQAFAEGIVLGAILWFIWRKPRLPGVVGCWFMISYGIMRILTELYRLPDDNLAVQRIAGLSRGQWLSAAMIVTGAIILTIIIRRGGQKIGGWAIKRQPSG
jgi:phosphatidylglycerol---prolipoprotein diacylglyceryl transferase